MECATVPVRNGHRHAREVDIDHCGLVELGQVRVIEHARPRAACTHPAGHGPRVQLPARVVFTQPQAERELSGVVVPGGFEARVRGCPDLRFDVVGGKLPSNLHKLNDQLHR